MTRPVTRPGDILRERLARPEPLLLAGVWDPLSALAARSAGMEGLFLSGFCVAGTHLGLPDLGYLTQTEMADAARRVCGAVPRTPVVVDGDTGYGSAHNVARTVALWEQAGAAGVFIEDQVWPKRCGHMAGKQVVSCDDWLAKLQAALDHRTHLFVTARTDALATHGLDEAIARARRAAGLGVDAVFVEAPTSVSDLGAVSEALSAVADAVSAGPAAPVLVANMVEGGATPLLTPEELAGLGYRLVVSPLSGLLAASRALRSTYARLAATGTLRENLDDLDGFDDVTALVDLDGHRALDVAPPAGDSEPT